MSAERIIEACDDVRKCDRDDGSLELGYTAAGEQLCRGGAQAGAERVQRERHTESAER